MRDLRGEHNYHIPLISATHPQKHEGMCDTITLLSNQKSHYHSMRSLLLQGCPSAKTTITLLHQLY